MDVAKRLQKREKAIMTTHKTLESARTAAKSVPGCRWTVEIEHATEGRCFINTLGTLKGLSFSQTKSEAYERYRRIMKTRRTKWGIYA